jgi:hypothetical protein
MANINDETIELNKEDLDIGLILPPSNIWEVYPFGKNVRLVIALPDEISLWRRIMFKLFFGVYFVRI